MGTNGNGYDDDRPQRYYHAEGASGIGGGANVAFYGASERTVTLLILLPMAASFVAVGYSFWAGGNATARAQGAVELSQIAERNAKLAQYQLEEALKKLNIDVPNELPEEANNE